MLLCIPPNGVLSMNEEVYFAMAERAVAPQEYGPLTGFMETTRTRLLFNWPVGWLVHTLGGETAQIVTRTLLALCFAWTLAMLARRLHRTVLDMALIIAVFFLLEQDILGGDWVFVSVESKAVVYVLLFAALAMVFDGRMMLAALLCALGTYMHFQAAGLWWLFIVIWQGVLEKKSRDAIIAMAVYLVCCIPQIYIIIQEYAVCLGSPYVAENGWSADYIYSVWRIPHHVAPFASVGRFAQWAPGIGLLFGSLLCVWWLWKTGAGRAKSLAGLLLVALLWMAAFVCFMALDTQHVLGKLYPFRPGSVALLLLLLLANMELQARLCHRATLLAWLLLFTIGPVFVAKTADAAFEPIHENMTVGKQRDEIVRWIAEHLPVNAVVLVPQDMEMEFMRLERDLSMPIWANFRSIPTRPDAIIEWYSRTTTRDALFKNGCTRITENIPATHLIVNRADAAHLSQTCGPILYEGKSYSVIRFLQNQ